MKSIHAEPYRAFLSMLVDARQEARLTQTQLSARLGKPQSFVAKYENGERRLDVLEFLTICHHLGADPLPIIQHMKQQLSDHFAEDGQT